VAIPETKLVTWSHQPAPGPSRDTYAAVKGVLEDTRAPFAAKSPDVYLQGSYGNDTNVARESDVDVVASIATTFGHDANRLPSEQYHAFERAYPDSASYSYMQYKADVAGWLTSKYGSGVRNGSKAIYIPAGQNRRECDVLPAVEFRYYYRFNSMTDQSYTPGICFYLSDGTQIVNFPKEHSSNSTLKHQDTNSRFKPTVRMYKNMRNYMVDQALLQDGVAPSYFIEGMLYNVPKEKFSADFSSMFLATHTYIVRADRSKFFCANGIHSLLGNSHVSWSSANCDTYLNALSQLWNDWS
jgi:hypothetical protein